ncbi:ankyrin repeat domain-containing protein [Parashewanella curva]|uniref:ankyrin repeat domain-containing protein n=1 Tax=Parashewanella curva TaxID=2338552 RepID=UPI001404642B|nr:ankyrin repeat domain-containing protein [Parashewanella curva]
MKSRYSVDTDPQQKIHLHYPNAKITPDFVVNKMRGSKQQLVEFLKSSPNFCNDKKQNLFHLSVLTRQRNRFDVLHQHQVNINALDCDGKTPLDHAVEIGDAIVIATLLSLGAKKSSELNPKQRVIKADFQHQLAASVQRFTQIEEQKKREFIVHRFGDMALDEFKALVKPSELHLPYYSEKSIVELSAHYGRFDFLEYLDLHYRGSVQISNLKQPLQEAIDRGYLTLSASPRSKELCFCFFEMMIKEQQSELNQRLILLLKHRAELRAFGDFCLQIRAKDELLIVINRLQEVECYLKQHSDIPFFISLLELKWEPHVAALITALPKSSETQTLNQDLLSKAIASKHLSIDALTLLLTKADVNTLDSKGHTALYYACKSRQTSLVTKLLEAKANPMHAGEQRRSAMMLVAESGSHDYLLEFVNFEFIWHQDKKIRDAVWRNITKLKVAVPKDQIFAEFISYANEWQLTQMHAVGCSIKCIEENRTPEFYHSLTLQQLPKIKVAFRSKKQELITAGKPLSIAKLEACQQLFARNPQQAKCLIETAFHTNEKELVRFLISEVGIIKLLQPESSCRHSANVTFVAMKDDPRYLSKCCEYFLCVSNANMVTLGMDRSSQLLDFDFLQLKPVEDGQECVIHFIGHGPEPLAQTGEFFANYLLDLFRGLSLKESTPIKFYFHTCQQAANMMEKENRFLTDMLFSLAANFWYPKVISSKVNIYTSYDGIHPLAAKCESDDERIKVVEQWQGSRVWLEDQFQKKHGFTGISENNYQSDFIKVLQYQKDQGNISETNKYAYGEIPQGLVSLI